MGSSLTGMSQVEPSDPRGFGGTLLSMCYSKVKKHEDGGNEVTVYLWLWCPACDGRRCALSCQSSPRPGSTAPEGKWISRLLPFDS